VLEEYRAFSHGRLEIEFADPGNDPPPSSGCASASQGAARVLERDQFQLTGVYLGLVMLHGGRQEVIPVIQDAGNLEYRADRGAAAATSRARRWSAGSAPGGRPGRAAATRCGAGSPALRPAADRAGGLTKVPDEVEDPGRRRSRAPCERARYALDQFVMRGGRAVFLVDHFEIPEGPGGRPRESGVHDLLERYGVKVAQDVVGEPRLNAPAAFSSGFMQFRIAYPWWLRVPGTALDREHPVTARLEDVVLPWTSSLEPAVPAGGRVKATVLARSSKEAFWEAENYDFSPHPRREVDRTATRPPSARWPTCAPAASPDSGATRSRPPRRPAARLPGSWRRVPRPRSWSWAPRAWRSRSSCGSSPRTRRFCSTRWTG
jgi:hypothetical protein